MFALRINRRELLGAEDAVARVAQTGDDVAVLVEMIVERCDIDVHIRSFCITATPSGAPMMHMSLMCLQPTSFMNCTAADALPPVASMGSTMMTSRSEMSGGILK